MNGAILGKFFFSRTSFGKDLLWKIRTTKHRFQINTTKPSSENVQHIVPLPVHTCLNVLALAFALPLHTIPSLRKTGWECFTECPGVLSGKSRENPNSAGKLDSQRISSTLACHLVWINLVLPSWICWMRFATHSTQALLQLHKVMISPHRFYKCLMVLEHRLQPMGTGDWHSTSWWQNRAVDLRYNSIEIRMTGAIHQGLVGNAIQQFDEYIDSYSLLSIWDCRTVIIFGSKDTYLWNRIHPCPYMGRCKVKSA